MLQSLRNIRLVVKILKKSYNLIAQETPKKIHCRKANKCFLEKEVQALLSILNQGLLLQVVSLVHLPSESQQILLLMA